MRHPGFQRPLKSSGCLLRSMSLSPVRSCTVDEITAVPRLTFIAEGLVLAGMISFLVDVAAKMAVADAWRSSCVDNTPGSVASFHPPGATFCQVFFAILRQVISDVSITSWTRNRSLSRTCRGSVESSSLFHELLLSHDHCLRTRSCSLRISETPSRKRSPTPSPVPVRCRVA